MATSEVLMLVQSLASLLVAGATVWTLRVVMKYTRETSLLRKAAERQNLLGMMPVVTVRFASLEHPLGDRTLRLDDVVLVNVGNVPAFNVQIESLAWNGVRVDFDRVSLLERDQPVKVSYSVLQGEEKKSGKFAAALLPSLITRGFPAELAGTIRYQDSAGNPYELRIRMMHRPEALEFETRFCGARLTGPTPS
jgi:hypothetical protein